MEQVRLLNTSMDNISSHQLLENLRQGGSVFTLNVDHLMKLQKDFDFYRAYTSATYRVCDSQILKYASKLVDRPIREKISGSDLFPQYIKHFRNDSSVTLFLLGAGSGIAEIARHKINHYAGRTMVVDVYSPSYGFEKNSDECKEIVERINRSKATTVIVSLGAPKQEIWIHNNRHKLPNVKVFLAVGAALDFEAGNRKRSPRWMSELGLEWLYRLLSEPQRLWKRYLVESLPLFWLLPLQMLRLYRAPERVMLARKPVFSTENCDLLLFQAGLLSSQQLETARQIHSDFPHLHFGEIVVIKGWLRKKTVNFFIKKLPKLATDMRQRPIGDYLKQAGLLNDKQIRSLLEEQKRNNILFGDLAVRKGWVSRTTVDFFLQYVAPDCETLPYAPLATPSLNELSDEFNRTLRERNINQDPSKIPPQVLPTEEIAISPLQTSAESWLQHIHSSANCRFKRTIDILGSLVGLCITSIVFIPIAIAIVIDSPGPILFSQLRCGLRGKTFRIWKFRTMVDNAESLQHKVENKAKGLIFKNESDSRITRVGRFLRQNSLDELPQFWNVLVGDMSLVGTRPPLHREVFHYQPHHFRRLQVKPGITGEWQVHGRSEVRDFEDILALDMRYQKRWSLRYDLTLLLKTIGIVIKKKGAC